jgi:molecular chaperone DnaK
MFTIDHGIDLGTTNSAIAVQDHQTPRLFPDEHGDVLLPSVVHVSRTGELSVGRRARAMAGVDVANTALEFKRQMGVAAVHEFPASGKRLSPEQLSAEVLRALLARVAATEGEAPRAAVITIPAMFQLPQCDATRRAASLAGIEHAVLVQEPIAAAIAHAGSGEVRSGSWLVYDLGGGTFDVSLVRCKDGRLQVLDHDGDNHLGGRDLDRVVSRCAVERVRADGRLGELKRTDPANAEIYGRIKVEAERVRVALSREPRARFELRDRDVVIGFELDRDELEALLLPTIQRTTRLCNQVLARNRIEAQALSGLVMVGGPTLTPCVLRVVSAEVGIEVAHSGDPMTIVARGAALFASMQRMPAQLRRERTAAIALDLEYEAMTTNPEPLVAGKVVASSPASAGLQIVASRGREQFVAAVQPNGAFALELRLAPSSVNVFQLAARSPAGLTLTTDPDAIKILHGFSIARPPLSQSIGVVLADRSVAWYLRKGAPLPARHTTTHTTTLALRRGQSGEAVHVPLVQGESARAEHNKQIGVIRIHAHEIARDLPAGSAVEVSVSVDASSQTVGRAYVPSLDQWFDDVVRFDLEARSADDVKSSFAGQKDRLAELASLADGLAAGGERPDARIADIEALLDEGDRDAVDVADQLVRTLTVELDAAASARSGAVAKRELEDALTRARSIIGDHGAADERRVLAALDSEIRGALARGDLDAARARTEDLHSLELAIVVRQPGFWSGLFGSLCERVAARDGATAQIQQGKAAIARDDLSRLPEICRSLLDLLPSAEQAELAPAIRSDIA